MYMRLCATRHAVKACTATTAHLEGSETMTATPRASIEKGATFSMKLRCKSVYFFVSSSLFSRESFDSSEAKKSVAKSCEETGRTR